MKAATLDAWLTTECGEFQSTPPVKAATCTATRLQAFRAISIHAAREGGDASRVTAKVETPISIHAAREGGDGGIDYGNLEAYYFNPRRP